MILVPCLSHYFYPALLCFLITTINFILSLYCGPSFRAATLSQSCWAEGYSLSLSFRQSRATCLRGWFGSTSLMYFYRHSISYTGTSTTGGNLGWISPTSRFGKLPCYNLDSNNTKWEAYTRETCHEPFDADQEKWPQYVDWLLGST